MPKSKREKKAASEADKENESLANQRPPTKFATRLTLPENSRSKSRRRKPEPSQEKARKLTVGQLREETAWKQVEETGKPIVFEDTLLIPEGMTFWEAVEFLPEGIREQTRSAMQKKIAEVHFNLVRRKRDQFLVNATEDSKWEQYKTFPYAAQMAIADSIVRQQLEMPEIPIPELIELYGGKIEKPSGSDKEDLG